MFLRNGLRVIALAGVLGLGLLSFATENTFTGVVTDDMCGKKHTMIPGKPDADCIRACVKAGSKYALLVGDKVYKLEGQKDKVDKFAGQKAAVNGSISGDTIRVASIAVAK